MSFFPTGISNVDKSVPFFPFYPFSFSSFVVFYLFIYFFPDFWCRATPPDKGVTRKEGPCLVPCEATAKRWPNTNNSALIHPRLPHGKRPMNFILFYSFYIQDFRKWMKIVQMDETTCKPCSQWMKTHSLIYVQMKYTRKKRSKREVTGGGPIWISKNLWTARYLFCNWPEELEYKSRRECTEIISVIRLLWLVTGRNLFLDKVGKNKKKLEKIEYYNPPPLYQWPSDTLENAVQEPAQNWVRCFG